MKKVLITGTSRGIGRATAERFLSEGWYVIGTSTTGKSDTQNKNYECWQLDLVNKSSIENAAKEITTKHPEINVLVNNAGVLHEEDEDPMDVGKLRTTFEVNVFGLVDFCERVLPNVKEQVVNVSSRMGNFNQTPGEISPAYSMSKAAVNMYTLKLSRRMRGVIVSSFSPGWVRTDMGGPEAPREPKEVARELFDLATTPHETGKFWHQGKMIPF